MFKCGLPLKKLKQVKLFLITDQLHFNAGTQEHYNLFHLSGITLRQAFLSPSPETQRRTGLANALSTLAIFKKKLKYNQIKTTININININHSIRYYNKHKLKSQPHKHSGTKLRAALQKTVSPPPGFSCIFWTMDPKVTFGNTSNKQKFR